MLIEKSYMKIFHMRNYCGLDNLSSPLSLKTVLSIFEVSSAPIWVYKLRAQEWNLGAISPMVPFIALGMPKVGDLFHFGDFLRAKWEP